ncbi:unnamed protein product [Effrenium voratum]|nr:unnamed protein product [Effrenium voratum]
MIPRLQSVGDSAGKKRLELGLEARDSLVPLDVAWTFVGALEAKYLAEEDQALEKFFQDLGPLEHLDILLQTQQIFERSKDPAKSSA